MPLKERRAVVLVQGEIAQSPRMLNHVRMLLASGWQVALAGFAGVPLPPDLLGRTGLSVHVLARTATQRWARLPATLYLAAAFARMLWIGAATAFALARAARGARVLLVQNPPAVPLLAIARIVASANGARLVADWHNTTFSLLGMRLGVRHPLVRAVRALEGRLARRCDAHLFVSHALRDDVRGRWNVDGPVVRDRPLQSYTRVHATERAAVLERILAQLRAKPLGTGAWIVAVSPTSWSIDEDMTMLAEALAFYASDAASEPLVLFATGIGPGRAEFERRTQTLPAERVRVVTGWLDEPQYRVLLGCAGIGICMHRSSSGADVPMKIVDMLACGVPPIAYDYGPALREALPPGAGVFTNARELAARLHAPQTAVRAPEPPWPVEWREYAEAVLSA